MPVAIRNLTSRPIFVSLNSGTSLRLSASEVASQVPDVELKNNAKIDKLIAQRAIAVEPQVREVVETVAKPHPHAREKRASSADPSDQIALHDAASPHPPA
ncbi:MAG: hypothetical protein ABTS22_13185 [Accumulibacter sp.]|jgi:hypothetical protein|uniref:hypothetical protein n=1 Tax=Accumulibacter sp. TaxID=2053492 RepID=UPI0033150DD7